MTKITNLTGVSFNDSKNAMMELLIFELKLALVSKLNLCHKNLHQGHPTRAFSKILCLCSQISFVPF